MSLTDYLKKVEEKVRRKLPDVEIKPNDSNSSEYLQIFHNNRLVATIYDKENIKKKIHNIDLELHGKNLMQILESTKVYLNLMFLNLD